ncbi:STAS domain-containing protein [Kitasatospora sp. CMC57]|uniref:STAS domain-containing protein n=1 Tax=Kitasatospora sp. CMC57 TaxID=3231513 RepID=UPI0038B665EC
MAPQCAPSGPFRALDPGLRWLYGLDSGSFRQPSLQVFVMHTDDLLRTQTLLYQDTAVISLDGELDLATGPLVTRAVTQALAAGPRQLDLDVAALTFCDAAGLRTILSARRASRVQHAEFQLVGVQPRLHRILALLRVTSLLPPHPLPPDRAVAPGAGPSRGPGGRSLPAGHPGGEGVDGFVGGVLEEVAVKVDGDGERGVAHGLGDHGGREVLGDHDAGGGVAQVVQADLR